MTVLSLDWNATRLRALLGAIDDFPLPVPLEPPSLELATILSLESHPPQPGSAGKRLFKQAPHRICHDFLPYLDQPRHAPLWKAGRHPLTAPQAATSIWQRVQGVAKGCKGVVLTLPSYVTRSQADILRELGSKLKLPILGSIPSPLAAALAAHAEQFWSRTVLVLDVDDHALTISLVKSSDDKAHLVDSRILKPLGLVHWYDRFLNALADLCVWQIRRDPRDNSQAEQNLFEQLESLFDAIAQQQAIQLALQTPTWYHHILLQPEQGRDLAAPLVESALGEAERLVQNYSNVDPPVGIVLTHAASLLPGLADAARTLVQAWEGDRPISSTQDELADDFGEDLIFDMASEVSGVLILPADAPSRAAHHLSTEFLEGTLVASHLEYLAPLPSAQPVDAGPARLHFRGQDYFLREARFMLGVQAGCHLRFDPHHHSEVANKHCEIVFDDRTFILFNRSREGTLVNDHNITGSIKLQAGDWIRLGLNGPAIRFLGRPMQRLLPTFA